MSNRSKYLVIFTAEGVPTATALLGAEPVTIPSGYGGWTVVSRERRVGLTQWQGKDPLRMAVPILFDGVADRVGQELEISHLSRMALPPVGGGEPPVVGVDGAGVPQPGPVEWVIENLQWGNNVIWDFTSGGVMSRLRQDCVVNLLEYRAEDRVAFGQLATGATTGKSKSGWPKSYVVKSGDTLSKIASTFYNNASKWGIIAKANKITDPRSVVKGQHLTIPAP